MFISKEDSDKAANTAKEIAKYAFALSFFLEYQNADAEVARCQANLRHFTEQLCDIVDNNKDPRCDLCGKTYSTCVCAKLGLR